ncbi:MAG: 23S rRNA (pseudouridine(1915)-N(3))-methyltransferase RlmH [Bacteroidales bacterium]|nr:23S rRNA (pseudouridine(1915)-N(3))-methyltransferase RlmH [Bacteroidales bacterium]
MKIKVYATAKTEEPYLRTGVDIYCNKLTHYFPFEYIEIPAPKQIKNLNIEQQKIKEGEIILDKILPADTMVILDENGKNMSSVGFADFLQKKMQISKQLVFVIGGPYGFSPQVYERSNFKLSLSMMTFSHQMVRLIFLEQLYRAASILKNEPYHHQ